MKRIGVIAMTSIFYLLATLATAQQTPSQGTDSATAPWAVGSSGASDAPVAGPAAMGVTAEAMEAILLGWSVKKVLLGKRVINDKKEKIGTIDDIVLTPAADAKAPFASFAIIGVGGFLGIGKKDVAIPIEQIKIQDGKLVLPNSSKEALKALPKFEYVLK